MMFWALLGDGLLEENICENGVGDTASLSCRLQWLKTFI